MLQAYVDDSGDGDPEVFVLAGWVASAETWANFSDEWGSLLKLRSLDVFKMKEMKGRPEVVEEFYRIIEKHAMFGISCSVQTKALKKVIRETDFGIKDKKKLAYVTSGMRNPLLLAFHQLVFGLARNLWQVGINEPIDFIFDQEAKVADCLEAWGAVRDHCEDPVYRMLGNVPIFRNDHDFLPLQAADLHAWWIRKWEKDKDYDAITEFRFPWKLNRKMPRTLYRMDEKDMLGMLEDSRKLAWMRVSGIKPLRYLKLY